MVESEKLFWRPLVGRRTNYNNIELETTLEQFVLDLLGNRVKANIGGGTNLLDICGGHCVK